ncbi:MAG TPA: nucleotide disphospho-sugar-binding domain-containing protein [Marmoricola sp.]|nr:nucleotide disphospho-sugar-binding domain-containing protein [Marmoricola sp.]
MSTILFATWDGGGNLPPALAIAAELVDRGHDVRFLGHRAQADRVQGAGAAFTAYPSARDFDATAGPSLPRLLATFSDRALGRDVLAELAVRPPHLVVVDCYLFGVMHALREAAVPYVVLEHSFDGNLRRDLAGPLALMLRLRGVRPRALVDSGRAVLVPTLATLDQDAAPGVVHTGPVVAGTPARPDEPTVLVSLSTFRFRGLVDTWQRVLDAVEGLPARVVATTGPAVDPSELRVPGSVEVHRWLPHAEVLPRVSVVVGHGGHGTTMAALAHGLPLLVLPVESKTDQPFIGRTVERVGAGRTLSRRSAPARIRTAVEELLADGPHRAAAEALGAQIREADGRRRGADLLGGMLATHPVQP